MYSSKKQDWETPTKFFDDLHERFNFNIDVASNGNNAKLERYFTEKQNALNQQWEGRVFCNPPYGREIKHWIKKAQEESLKPYNDLIVLLIPARTDTSYWHDYIFGKAEVEFLRGRLKFEVNGEQKGTAPFPSALVIYQK